MAALLTDVRFGLRALRRSPAFVVLGVTCLGIGIGASVMTFTVLDRTLLRPFGPIDTEGLVAVGEVRRDVPDEWWPASWANFGDWRTAMGEDAQLSAYRSYSFDVSARGWETRVEGAQVTENLFAVLGVAPVFGPGLTVGDTMAGQVGRQFRLDAEDNRGWVTVVGVSGNFLTWDSNGEEPLPIAFLDIGSFSAYPVFYFIRKRDAGLVVSPELIYRAIDAFGVPVKRTVVTPMAQVAMDPFWRQRIFSLWFIAFGATALTLTAIGIYGVLAYVVRQRRQEIGIRMALGAGRRSVLLMVMRQGTVFAGGGILAGLAGAYLLARSMQGLLFGVEPLDLTMFVIVPACLAAVAMAASVLPAVRASRIDPNLLLKR